MHEAAATPAWVLLAYLISGVCFILALRTQDKLELGSDAEGAKDDAI